METGKANISSAASKTTGSRKILKKIILLLVCWGNFRKNSKPNCHRKHHGRANSLPNIPDDVVWEILSRLPVKSVLRFRCVSKGWNLLLSSSQFYETHLINYRESVPTTYIMFKSGGGCFRFCSVHNLLYEPIVDSSDGNLQAFRKRIVGSYNGLICLAGTHKNVLILWNPSTRERVELPKTPFLGDNLSNGEVFYQYGFGFDKSKDDFKVVCFAFPDEYHMCDGVVSIYSMRTGRWKRIKNYRGGWIQLDLNKFGNGKINWMCNNYSRDWYVCYLDLVTEKYGTVRNPPNAEGIVLVDLEVVEGCLYVLCTNESCRQLWSLEGNYGSDETTWTKLVSIQHDDIPGCYDSNHFHVLENGEILLVYESSYVLFNMKDCSIRYPKFRGDYSWRYYAESIPYVPSLVSPFRTDIGKIVAVD